MDKYESSEKGKHRCCGLCRAMARPGGGGERVARASRVTSNNIIFGRYGFRDAKSAGPGGANVVVRVDTKLPPEALRHAAESAAHSGELRSRHTADLAAHGSFPWDELRVWDPGD